MKLNKQNKKGFTIVELVIVIAVIGILSAILIPTFANLTNEAQKAARKQQAADAYTAYLVEATDNQYDGLYTRSASEPYTYTQASVAIANKSQANVALNLKGTSYWFTYNAEKGWQEAEAQPTGTSDLVCKPFTAAATATTALYTKNGDNYSAFIAADTAAADANAKLSTFNGALVYILTVNA